MTAAFIVAVTSADVRRNKGIENLYFMCALLLN